MKQFAKLMVHMLLVAAALPVAAEDPLIALECKGECGDDLIQSPFVIACGTATLTPAEQILGIAGPRTIAAAKEDALDELYLMLGVDQYVCTNPENCVFEASPCIIEIEYDLDNSSLETLSSGIKGVAPNLYYEFCFKFSGGYRFCCLCDYAEM